MKYITGCQFKNICNDKNIIFVDNCYIEGFIRDRLNNIKIPFILITTITDGTGCITKELLDNKYLIKWYGVNMIKSEKTEGVPVGLPILNWNGYPQTKLNSIEKLKKKDKTKLVYNFFSIYTNANREKWFNVLLKNGIKRNYYKGWLKYMTEMSEYFYCISPEGNGVDCHRTWEALYLGVVPVVLKNNIMTDHFSELPILFVDNYEMVTPAFLENQKHLFSSKNTKMLDINYWLTKIKKSL